MPPYSQPPDEGIDDPFQAHSDQVAEMIHRAIEKAGGAIDFSEFMERALYSPGWGYYMTDQPKLGAGGNFITAPELGSGFGGCIARQVEEVLEQIGGGEVFEVGGGSGALAHSVLNTLADRDALPDRYWLLEVSPALRQQQKRRLGALGSDLASRVAWTESLPEPGFRGVVLGNEVLDAMAVSRFRIVDDLPRRLLVSSDGEDFYWALDKPDHDFAAACYQRIGEDRLEEGYESEIGLRAEGWIASMGERLEAGCLLLVDYGFPSREFFHPERSRGTLRTHSRHHADENVFKRVGTQDITAHVDFSAVARAGTGVGLEVEGYTQQGAFLLSLGLLDHAADKTQRAFLQATAEIRRLTLPSDMGELFKVIALGKGLTSLLSGFTLQDHSRRL